MAKGIDLAGGYGAGGVRDALVDLIAQRMAQQEFEDLRVERAAALKRQSTLDAQAAEDRSFNRTRLTKQDERTDRQDAQAEKDKNTARLMKLAENFPGARAKRSAFGDVPADLDALILKPLDPTIASTAIGGFASMPGAARREGAMTTERRAAIEPGTVELQQPESERARLAQARQDAFDAKAEKDRELSEKRLGETQRHNEVIETLRANAAAAAGARRGSMTETGQLNAIEKLNTKYQTNTKAAREVQRQYGVMEQGMAAYDNGLNKGTAEQSVVMAFNKILDPDSVVREGEYDRTSQGQSLLNRMHALALKVPAGGQIAPAVLKDMLTLSRTYRDQAAAHQQRERKRIERLATHFELPRDLILTDDEDDNQVDEAAGAPAGSPAGASSGTAGGSGFRIKSVRPASR